MSGGVALNQLINVAVAQNGCGQQRSKYIELRAQTRNIGRAWISCTRPGEASPHEKAMNYRRDGPSPAAKRAPPQAPPRYS